jgi:hypothetical protein
VPPAFFPTRVRSGARRLGFRSMQMAGFQHRKKVLQRLLKELGEAE